MEKRDVTSLRHDESDFQFQSQAFQKRGTRKTSCSCTGRGWTIGGALTIGAALLITGIALTAINGKYPTATALMATGGSLIGVGGIILLVTRCQARCHAPRIRKKTTRIEEDPTPTNTQRFGRGDYNNTTKKYGHTPKRQTQVSSESKVEKTDIQDEPNLVPGKKVEITGAMLNNARSELSNKKDTTKANVKLLFKNMEQNWKVCVKNNPSKKAWTSSELAKELAGSPDRVINVFGMAADKAVEWFLESEMKEALKKIMSYESESPVQIDDKYLIEKKYIEEAIKMFKLKLGISS